MNADPAAPAHPALAWWQHARFGMFLHFGVYSLAAGAWKGAATPAEGPWQGKPYTEFVMMQARIPVAEYERFARAFDPMFFDADAWVRSARDAGMGYVVITAKHHDGFALYDSASSPFSVARHAACRRDLLRELADACARHGLRLCVYYSLGRDWHDPDVPTSWPTRGGRSNTWDYPDEDGKVFERYFARKVMPQVRELLTGYGPIGALWFDTPELIDAGQSRRLLELVRSLQPDCLVNDRIGNGLGDFATTEQELPSGIRRGAWEACITMSRNWCYSRHDRQWKSAEMLIRHLVDAVAKGGNLLLNVNPMPEGVFPQEAVERLAAIGAWLRVHGEAVVGAGSWLTFGEALGGVAAASRPAEVPAGDDTMKDAVPSGLEPDIRYTATADAVYAILRGRHAGAIELAAFAAGRTPGLEIHGVRLLGSTAAIRWRRTSGGLAIEVPAVGDGAIPVQAFRIATTAAAGP